MQCRTLFASFVAVSVVCLVGCVGSAVEPADTEQPGDSQTDTGCTPAGCDDGQPCNGIEGCDAQGHCVEGEPLAEGTPCDGPGDGAYVCRQGLCIASGCGDGFVDGDHEDCDDGNRIAGDGCELDCSFTCALDLDCDDETMCNGVEQCDPSAHTCTAGTPLADGTQCDTQRECIGGECRSASCGDTVVQEDAGEECDDGNANDGDGCDNDCTFSCSDDLHCSDFDVCSGWEWCDFGAHVCQVEEPLSCDDENACTQDQCDAEVGCVFELIDADGDGHAPMTLGDCGSDCDDLDSNVFAGAEELCDGIDNNCDGAVDEIAPTWFIDCDGDGFAGSVEGSVNACDTPSYGPPSCTSTGTWVALRPDFATTDCDDTINLVRPDQKGFFEMPIREGLGFDYNCDGLEEQQYATFFDLCFMDADRVCRGRMGWTLSFVPQCGTTGLPPRTSDTNFGRCGRTGILQCGLIASQEVQSCR